MTQNPFESLGGADGFDMNALLAQAQQMQDQIHAAHEELLAQRFSGVAAGKVTVEVSGAGEVTAVTIAEGAVESTSADDLEVLGDLIVAAYRDAKTKADDATAAALGPMAGGLPGLG